MNGRKHTVLWELTSVKGAPALPSPQSYVRASTLPNDKEADADDSDDDEATVYSLPFKVLGTCYMYSQQEVLKRHFSLFQALGQGGRSKPRLLPARFFNPPLTEILEQARGI